MRTRSIVSDVARGAAAGAAATWLMDRTTTWMYERESEEAKQRENLARGNRTAYERAAEKVAGVAGVELSDDRRSRFGTAIHWATGVSAGIAYALLRRRSPAVAAAGGLAFGAAFFLVVDELLNPALGLTPGPRAFPWQAHARGLGGHLAFGVTSALVLRAADRVA